MKKSRGVGWSEAERETSAEVALGGGLDGEKQQVQRP